MPTYRVGLGDAGYLGETGIDHRHVELTVDQNDQRAAGFDDRAQATHLLVEARLQPHPLLDVADDADADQPPVLVEAAARADLDVPGLAALAQHGETRKRALVRRVVGARRGPLHPFPRVGSDEVHEMAAHHLLGRGAEYLACGGTHEGEPAGLDVEAVGDIGQRIDQVLVFGAGAFELRNVADHTDLRCRAVLANRLAIADFDRPQAAVSGSQAKADLALFSIGRKVEGAACRHYQVDIVGRYPVAEARANHRL